MPEQISIACYLGWMGIGLAVTLTQITSDNVTYWNIPRLLNRIIQFCLENGDPISILLAALSTHWMAIRLWGLNAARRWAVLILVISAGVETLGALTGFPFGAYHYSKLFGPLLGHVLPLAIPVSWFVLITNVWILVRPRLPSRWMASLATGLSVTFLDWVMEPFAVNIKGYWYWESTTIPWQNYVSWLAITFMLCICLAPQGTPKEKGETRPIYVLGPMFLLFISSRLVHGI